MVEVREIYARGRLGTRTHNILIIHVLYSIRFGNSPSTYYGVEKIINTKKDFKRPNIKKKLTTTNINYKL